MSTPEDELSKRLADAMTAAASTFALCLLTALYCAAVFIAYSVGEAAIHQDESREIPVFFAGTITLVGLSAIASLVWPAVKPHLTREPQQL